MKLASVVVLAGLVALPSLARAGGTLDAVLCQRVDTRWSDGEDKTKKPLPYMSVAREAKAPSVTTTEGGDDATVCQDAAKKQCATIKPAARYELDINAAGTLLVGAGENSAVVMDAKTGKVKRKLISKRDKGYSCGGGLWMGDTVLAFGHDCEEFDALPFLANGKTGAYIAPLVDKTFQGNGETLYDVAHVDGKLWAIAAFDHYGAEQDTVDPTGLGFGKVFLVDITTGKVKATAHGVAGGGVVIDEGKQSRKLAKLAPCAP